MSRFVMTLLAALLVGLVQQSMGLLQYSPSECRAIMGGTNVTVLLVADPGDFSGTSEAEYYLSNLQGRLLETSSKNATVCVSKAIGSILGMPVMVASTGIGPTSAALCVSEILQCASNIKEIIYMGTSGWTAQVGGTINEANCTQKRVSPLTRLGDVCVTPWSMNWSCKLADWVDQCAAYPNQCNLPVEEDGPQVAPLYGQCVFSSYNTANLALSNEILAAATSASAAANYMPRNAAVRAKEVEYWTAMSDGVGINYTAMLPPSSAPPKIWNYTQCVEVDSQFFYSGSPWDATARNYSAITINQALNTTLTPQDVIAVSAMEAVGFSEAMYKFSALSGAPQIPFTVVRSNSDYLYKPVMYEGDGMWTAGEPVSNDFINGYSFAIASSSAAVLSLFQARCQASRTSPSCSIGIAYA